MRPHLRSALRVWTKRPAGPILLALGILVATLLAAGTQLALDGAGQAQRAEDARALGATVAAIRTPGGYAVDEAAAYDLQSLLAQGPRDGQAPAVGVPVHVERDALVTTAGTTRGDWRVLGLDRATLGALGLPPPEPGRALVDPGPHPLDEQLIARLQRAPQDTIRLHDARAGHLERTLYAGNQYVHADGDEYSFDLPVEPGAQRLVLDLATSGNGTDFDLEATAPDGTSYLDDDGTPAQPVMPRIEVDDPASGNWSVRVHAKAATQVAFRLEADRFFDARDARALGRLLSGRGFHAIGAQLGLTEQAVLELSPRRADLAALGPGDDGLIVLPLDRLQSALGLGERVDGILVRATPTEDPLEGLPDETLDALEQAVSTARAQATTRLDPLAGLEVHPVANRAADERAAQIDSTRQLLLVVLPAGVVAGVLLATWAAGLHTRRLAPQLRVMAGLGQSRSASWRLAALHLGPPVLLGVAGAFLLAPLTGLAIATGLGLGARTVLVPGPAALLVPLAALVPITATAYLSLRHPIEGQDPRAGDRPPTPGTRRKASAGWTLAAAVFLGLWLAPEGTPSSNYLYAALAGAGICLALLWAPALEPLLSRARSLSVPALGLYRTRSTHPSLALAAATATLVLGALVAGTALSQAATPDPALESGGYPVASTTPTYVENLETLADRTGATAQATQLASASLGTEFLMRVTGTGVHSADTGPEQTVYGIDRSFAQRHEHQVQPVGDARDPFATVAASNDAAVVSRDVWEALDGATLFVRGPTGRLPYNVVGIVETRLFEGVYLSQDALPTHFTRVGGQQRFLLGDETDPGAYAATLQDAFKDAGLRATTANALVADELSGQRRAGTTLQALAGFGLATALLLVVLLGIRARAERRASDAVLVAMGTPPTHVAAGIATETALPIAAGVLVGAALILPAAGALDAIEGLAFPLIPIDEAALLVATAVLLAVLLALTILVSLVIGWRAVQGLDQQALRELA